MYLGMLKNPGFIEGKFVGNSSFLNHTNGIKKKQTTFVILLMATFLFNIP